MVHFIIDVRAPHKYLDGYVEGTVDIPPPSMMTGAKEQKAVSKDANTIIYFRTGSRSNLVMHILKEPVYMSVTNGTL